MSAAVMGFAMVSGEIRQIPKWAMTKEELGFAYGSPDLVESLRKIGALMPAKNHGRTLLFDTGDAARVWADFKAGTFDQRLAAIGKV